MNPKTFKDDEPGFIHVDVKDLPRMPDEVEHCSLFAASDRAGRWVYFEVQPDGTTDTAAGFLERLRAKAPFLVRTVLTDNGKAFTDRFASAPPVGASRPDGTPSIKPAPHTASTTG